MTMDRVSNMLSSVKNAIMAQRPYVEIMYTKECDAIAALLKEKGYLENAKVFKESGKSYKMLHLDIIYTNGVPKMTDIKRLSKPGSRMYQSYKDMKRISRDYGMLVVSTSRGVMSGVDAKKKKLGGEVICEVH